MSAIEVSTGKIFKSIDDAYNEMLMGMRLYDSITIDGETHSLIGYQCQPSRGRKDLSPDDFGVFFNYPSERETCSRIIRQRLLSRKPFPPQIREMCGLSETNMEDYIPQLYDEMLIELCAKWRGIALMF